MESQKEMIQFLFAVSAVLFYQVVETVKSERYFFNHKEILNQILFTSNKSNRDKIVKISRITKTKISRIGKILSKKKFKFRLLNADKVLNFTKIPGYEHLFT